jgi:hypothetical protein
LHAEADAEQRLFEPGQRLAQSDRVDPLHCEAGGTDAGQHDALGRSDLGRIACDPDIGAEPLEADGDRSDIAAAQVDDGNGHGEDLAGPLS